MDNDPNQKKIQTAAILIFLFGLFVFALGAGLFLFKNSSSEGSDDVQIISANTVSPAPQAEILVDVDGAVVSPGLYRLSKDARVDDAVEAAGGLSSEADRAKVNLAAKVADGQKLRIPKVGETSVQSTGEVAGAVEGGLVSINNGSVSELESLPAVGPVTAQKIISLRPYSSLEELKTKKAVGASTFEKIAGLITL